MYHGTLARLGSCPKKKTHNRPQKKLTKRWIISDMYHGTLVHLAVLKKTLLDTCIKYTVNFYSYSSLVPRLYTCSDYNKNAKFNRLQLNSYAYSRL